LECAGPAAAGRRRFLEAKYIGTDNGFPQQSQDNRLMNHFGPLVLGTLTATGTLAVLWMSHCAGTNDGHVVVFGLAISPFLYLIFVGPFALLFLLSLIRRRK